MASIIVHPNLVAAYQVGRKGRKNKKWSLKEEDALERWWAKACNCFIIHRINVIKSDWSGQNWTSPVALVQPKLAESIISQPNY